MLRHQYQEGIFYSQTHVPLPVAMRFTYELFSPLAEHTPKSLNSAAVTTWRMNYMCRTLLNFRACILAIIEEPQLFTESTDNKHSFRDIKFITIEINYYPKTFCSLFLSSKEQKF